MDRGETWTRLSEAPYGNDCRWPRIDICKTGTHGSQFLILKNSKNEIYSEAYRTRDGGATWSLVKSKTWWNWEGWCDLIAVAPDDDKVQLLGGVALWSKDTSGGDWETFNLDDVYADQHRAFYAPSDSNIVYVCTDGGVSRSDDKGQTFRNVSIGLMITQFYDVGAWEPDTDTLGGGAQDQGTSLTNGSLTWERILGGDGGYLVIDPTDANTMYAEMQYTRIYKTTNGGKSWDQKIDGLESTSQWVGVITMDPNDNLTLYTGGESVFKTTNGLATPWVDVSQNLGSEVNSIAVAPSNSMRVYVGTGHFKKRTGAGLVFRTQDAGATRTWDDITGKLPSDRPVMDIIVDPVDENRLVVSYGGSTGGPALNVFICTNGGADTPIWTNISGNLPDITVSALAFNPNDSNQIYAGTDVGLFRTMDVGANWEVYRTGVPNCPISDLYANGRDNALIVATFGRGMYKIDIVPVVEESQAHLYLDSPKANWWESPGIKVVAAPFSNSGKRLNGVEFDRHLEHEDPVRGATNRVYLQVHNRGPADTKDVSVRIFAADAGAGLPPLPNPLTAPEFNLDGGGWTPIGPARTIPRLKPNHPVIVEWDYTVPDTVATHQCLLAVASSPDDPMTSTETSVPALVQQDKRVCLKNVHVVDTSAAGGNTLGTIDFNNPTDEEVTMDIEAEFHSMGHGNLGLMLEAHEVEDEPHACTNVEVLDLSDGEFIGDWYDKPSRLRASDGEAADIRNEIAERMNHLKSRIDLSRIYDFDTSKAGAIRGIRLKPGQKLRGALSIRPNRFVSTGETPRITIRQKEDGETTGGCTYDLPLKRAKGLHPVSRIRVVLEQVQMLGDQDPASALNAQVSFGNNPNRRHATGLQIDQEDRGIQDIDVVLYEGLVGIDDRMALAVMPQANTGDPEIHYRRNFPAPPESWVGAYAPHHEGQSPGPTSQWRAWYRIESLPL
ncbi:MAG: hypothetical protein AAF492_04850 [Verrucomicrobiota bacterium]